MSKNNTFRWFGYIEKSSGEYVKKAHVSEIVRPRRRGRPVVKRKDRVKEYMHERKNC